MNNLQTNLLNSENLLVACRVEDGKAYLQTYNAENQLNGIGLVSGNCDDTGNLQKVWVSTCDGDRKKFKVMARLRL